MSTRTITFNDSFSSASAPTGVDGISNWVTAQAYLVSDVVIQGSKIYECLIAHTAGVFATDLAAVKWGEISQGAVDHTALSNIGTNTHAQIDSHISSTSNPHSVTKAQIGLTNVDDTSDATKNAASVTLTNKTITGADFRTPTRLDMKQDTLANLTTYASTAADGQLCFATDTKATYVVKNNSLSSVGGAGAGINYILAPDADSGTTGWATYANAAATSPVDGTGGSPSSTFAASASSPLRGTSSFLWTKSAVNRQGEGFSYDFTIDASDKGKVLQCSFEYQIASGTFADNDMSVWIYDVTNAVLIQPAPYLIKNSGIIEKFAVEFQTASNSTSYRLIVHTGSTSASAYTMKFDNFIVGPQAKLYGSAITDWVSYTPTVANLGAGSSALNVAQYRRVGDSIEITGTFRKDATPGSGAGVVSFTIPTGLAIDTNKINITNVSGGLGTVWSFNVGAALVYETAAVRYSTSTTFIFVNDGTSSFIEGSALAASSYLSYNLQVPIVGWSSSQVFSQDADTRVVALTATTLSATAITNVNAGTTKLAYSTVVSDTHGGYNSSTGDYTVKVPGKYKITAQDYVSFASGAQVHAIYKNSSALFYGQYQFSSTGGIQAVSGTADLVAGDVISIRSFQQSGSGTATWGNSNISDILLIERISGPAQIAASESVSASYTGAPPTGSLGASFNIITYGTKVKDSHNAYSGGSYTVPVSGSYLIGASTAIAGTFSASASIIMSIFIDGVEKNRTESDTYSTSVGTSYAYATPYIVPLLAGQIVTIRSYASGITSPTFLSNGLHHTFSITKVGNY